MRNDEANDRRRRVPLIKESTDICCGCGEEMTAETLDDEGRCPECKGQFNEACHRYWEHRR
jgi:uncharacterized CHY-type Zn-finger protein